MQVEVGDKIKTKGRLGIWHYGIYVGPRGPTGDCVVHNSKRHRRVVLEHAGAFTEGREFFIERRAAAGHGDAIAERALTWLGTNYDVLSFNCEHFVNVVHEGDRSSPQLRTWGTLLTFAGAIGAYAWLSPTGTYDPNVDRRRDSRGRFTRG